MLVLSRRLNEDILFPDQGIRIRLLGLKGNAARIGIEAPPEVPVFRAEIAPNQAANSSGLLAPGYRNRLNKAALALHRFKEQWLAGLMAEANETLEQIIAVLDSLDRESAATLTPGA